MTPLVAALRLFLVLALLTKPSISAPSQNLEFADGLEYNNFYAVRIHRAGGEQFTLFDAASYDGDSSPWPELETVDGAGSYNPASTGFASTEFPPAASANTGTPPSANAKYFFWIRRIGEFGAITYPLPFSKIKEIEFTGPHGGRVSNPMREGRLSIDGSTKDVWVYLFGREAPDRFRGYFGVKEAPIPSFTPARITLTNDEVQSVFVKTDGFLGGIDEEFGTYGVYWLQNDEVEKIVFEHNGSFARCPECGAIFYDERNPVCPFDGAALVPSRER